MKSLICLTVFSMAWRKTVGPKPVTGGQLGSWPIRSRVSRYNANAHSLSVPPWTPRYHLSASLSARRRLMYFQPPSPPLCIHIRLPWEKGWQLSSLKEPSVVARTCANIKCDAVLEAIRCKLMQFHAGVVDVNMQGSGPSLGSV